jgi:O-antigen/teichoic acid export membrane protein
LRSPAGHPVPARGGRTVAAGMGTRELGFFAAMAYVLEAGNLVNNALGQSASPRLARYIFQPYKHKYLLLLFKLTCIGTGMALLGLAVVYFWGEELLIILYNPEFADKADIFFWIMAANAIRFAGGFLGYGITAARYFKIQMPINIISILNIYSVIY